LLAILAARSRGEPLPVDPSGGETEPAADADLTDDAGGDGDYDGHRIVSD
jgi:hypothetical protein